MGNPFEYRPSENDYKIWLVLNPAKWLVIMWLAVLVVALAVHTYVLTSPKYNYLAAPPRTAAAAPK